MEPTNDKALDDKELMLKAGAEDDREAFAELVDRYKNFLLNFFIRSGVNNDAEDLVQQTFLRLYRYRKNYRPTAKFTTFLFLIARQVRIDDLRKQKRHDEVMVDSPEGLPEDLPDRGHSPSKEVEMRLDLKRALRSLSEGLRSVVELGIYQDLPYADISTILGIPVGTVKSRMFHALAKLRQILLQDKEGKNGSEKSSQRTTGK